jgi:hypothetical protein
LQFPWYAIAGNHDHNGNVSAQIAYTQNSARWQFPATYHAHSFSADDGATVDIVMIDTVTLASHSRLLESQPGYFDPLPTMPRSADAAQWDWIEAQMKASTADYLLVVGHYPVYSVCEHGPTATLVDQLRPLLLQYGAHSLSGHDHCMEHFSEPDGSNTHYFLSGMGVECCYRATKTALVPKNSLKWYIAADNAAKGITAGFSSFKISKQSMTVTYYDQAGNVLYTTPSIPPRTKQ